MLIVHPKFLGASLFWGDPDVPSYEECSQQDWHADFDPDVPDANILQEMKKEQHVSGSPSNQSMQRCLHTASTLTKIETF